MSMEIKRRSLLTGGLGLGALAGLSGCNLVGSAPQPTTGGAGSGASGLGGSITVAIVPDPAGASAFYKEQFDKFSAQTGVKVTVIENPADQQLNAVELSFQQGNAPDVYRAQGTAAVQRFAARNWAADLTDLAAADGINDQLGAANMNPKNSGLHFDGKLLSLPLVSGVWSATHVMAWNKELFDKAGLDKAPTTFGEFEDYARQITAAGKGAFYGLAPNGSTAGDSRLLQPSGGPNSITRVAGINLITGKAGGADPSMVEPIEMYRRLQADKIFEPGWESWDATRVSQEFAKGKIAMMLIANWLVQETLNLVPDLPMEIAPSPVPDSGRKGFTGIGPSFSPIWSMSSESKNPDAAWALMKFLVSDEFQQAYFEKFRSFTAVEKAWTSATLSTQESQMLEVHRTTLKRSPDPSLGTAAQQALIVAISGNADLKLGDVGTAAITRNQPYEAMAKEFDSKLDAFIDKAVKDLNAKGTKVSRDDLTYPDWDPMQDWQPS